MEIAPNGAPYLPGLEKDRCFDCGTEMTYHERRSKSPYCTQCLMAMAEQENRETLGRRLAEAMGKV